LYNYYSYTYGWNIHLVHLIQGIEEYTGTSSLTELKPLSIRWRILYC